VARFLVTGGAGFIGSHLVEALLERGLEVRVVDDLSTGRLQNLEPFLDRIDFRESDIRDEAAMRKAVQGVEVVLHQAALPSVQRSVEAPLLVNEVNVGGTLNLLECARGAGVRRFVYAASSSAYGDSETLPKKETQPPRPKSPYAVTKLVGEHYCSVYSHVFGLDTISLRYFNVFGPRQDPGSDYAAVIPIFVTRLLAGEAPTIHGDGDQSRDFTYIENVVEGNLLAAAAQKGGGAVVNLACGDRYTLNRLYATLQELTGTRIEARHGPPRPGDVRHSQADVAEARRLLGYETKVSFREGLKRTVEWFRQEPPTGAEG
jgi:nucleoside-diphosphate-sugar epimerase